jgi:hypothetical protein
MPTTRVGLTEGARAFALPCILVAAVPVVLERFDPTRVDTSAGTGVDIGTTVNASSVERRLDEEEEGAWEEKDDEEEEEEENKEEEGRGKGDEDDDECSAGVLHSCLRTVVDRFALGAAEAEEEEEEEDEDDEDDDDDDNDEDDDDDDDDVEEDEEGATEATTEEATRTTGGGGDPCRGYAVLSFTAAARMSRELRGER